MTTVTHPLLISGGGVSVSGLGWTPGNGCSKDGVDELWGFVSHCHIKVNKIHSLVAICVSG